MIFINNEWYVAGWLTEFGNYLNAIKLLNKKILEVIQSQIDSN